MVEVMKLINHRMPQWIRNQQFPIRTVLSIPQNLHPGDNQTWCYFLQIGVCAVTLLSSLERLYFTDKPGRVGPAAGTGRCRSVEMSRAGRQIPRPSGRNHGKFGDTA